MAVVLGTGATVVMDAWALVQKKLLGLPAQDFRMVGRWIGHMFSGHFRHKKIAESRVIKGEAALGWVVHYITGIVFAGMFLALTGLQWLDHSTLLPALAFGLATVAFPFLIMQPAMGAGIASGATPDPWKRRGRSLIAHFSFGAGLYLTGLVMTLFF